MKYCILIFVLIFHMYPSWGREPLLTDVLDKDINITASFDGAKIVIYGAIDTKLHKDSILIINIQIRLTRCQNLLQTLQLAVLLLLLEYISSKSDSIFFLSSSVILSPCSLMFFSV